MLLALIVCTTLAADGAEELNTARIDTGIVAMEVLLAWSAANIAAGGTLYALDNDRGPRRYFHQMNALWNVVNAGIATAGLVGLHGELGTALGEAEALEAAVSFEKILLFNAGLDLAYVAAGAYLYERGRRRDSSRLRGYGQSLWLQGGFLFAFDLAVYFFTHQHTTQMLDGLRVTPTGLAYSW
ncbi:MAG: hypothetical protein AAF658_14200 [Myxococcota bacterium]